MNIAEMILYKIPMYSEFRLNRPLVQYIQDSVRQALIKLLYNMSSTVYLKTTKADVPFSNDNGSFLFYIDCFLPQN
jgi:hypothetical protein